MITRLIQKSEILTLARCLEVVHQTHHCHEGRFNEDYFLISQAHLLDNGLGGIIIAVDDTQDRPSYSFSNQ